MITTMTEQEIQNNILTNIIAREEEVHNYQVNINNYTAMIAAIPDNWTPELLQYKGLTSEGMATQVPVELLETVSNLNFKDKLTLLLRTEIMEKSKANLIYNALVSQMDAETLPGLLAAHKAAM